MRGEVWQQHLHCLNAIGDHVAHFVHLPHSAQAEDGKHFVITHFLPNTEFGSHRSLLVRCANSTEDTLKIAGQIQGVRANIARTLTRVALPVLSSLPTSRTGGFRVPYPITG